MPTPHFSYKNDPFTPYTQGSYPLSSTRNVLLSRWESGRKENRCDATLYGPPQGGGRVDRRGGGRGPQEGPRSPGRIRGEVSPVLVQRGDGRGFLPSRSPRQRSGGGGPPGGSRARSGRDNRGQGRILAEGRGPGCTTALLYILYLPRASFSDTRGIGHYPKACFSTPRPSGAVAGPGILLFHN